MGKRAIYECQDYKKQFESIEGGSFRYIWVRCERCDHVQKTSASDWPNTFDVTGEHTITSPICMDSLDPTLSLEEAVKKYTETEAAVEHKPKFKNTDELEEARSRFTCDVCKSQLHDDPKPMCPICRSRNAIPRRTIVHFD